MRCKSDGWKSAFTTWWHQRYRHFPHDILNAFSWMKVHESLLTFHWGLGSNWQYSSICSDNGLARTRQQTIVWANDGMAYWRKYASLGLHQSQMAFVIFCQPVVYSFGISYRNWRRDAARQIVLPLAKMVTDSRSIWVYTRIAGWISCEAVTKSVNWCCLI